MRAKVEKDDVVRRVGRYATTARSSLSAEREVKELRKPMTMLNGKVRNPEPENEIVRALWGQPVPWYTAEQLAELTALPIAQVKGVLDYLKSESVVKSIQAGRGEVVALANNRAVRELALLLTKNGACAVDGSPDCRHHWMLERPDGEATRGVCRLCGAEKYFLSSTPAVRRGTPAVVLTRRTPASP